MKLSRTTLANLLRLSNGESIAASGLRKDIAEELRKEGLLTVRAQGSRRTMRAVDCAALRLYVEANYTMMDLDEAAAIGSGDNELTRACLAEATGDSKFVNVRSCPGFPVNAYSPIRCTLHGRELTVCPPEGSFMFISDWKEFAVGADALVVGIENMETFRKEVELIHQLGFDGKSIINPRQIEIINEVFTPTQKAIDKALAVIAAIKEAERKGSGVIAVNGKMVDRPVVIRAQRVIDLALASGVIKKEDLV